MKSAIKFRPQQTFRKSKSVGRILKFALLLFACNTLHAQPIDTARLDQLTEKYAKSSFAEFRELLSIPNDAQYPQHVQANLDWMQGAFEKRGFQTTILPSGGPPLLLAESAVADAQRTVLIYLQIDGQPVDSTKWFQESPYKPVLKKRNENSDWQQISWDSLQGDIDSEFSGQVPEISRQAREWRIFARSASDAKGPVQMFLTALDIFRAENLHRTYSIKVIMDFEEENGSPHLPQTVRAFREQLRADMLLIFDGPRHVSNQPSLTFGARGIATITLTVFGPRLPQHSGHYGNYVPNPAYRLARLLASMEDDSGRVMIPGFYDGVELDAATRAILAQVPDDEADIRRKIGIAETDRVAETLQEALQFPSLNIRGLAAGWVGEKVRTIIPAEATAEIDVRLVPESDPQRLIASIRQHIEKQGYHLVDGAPTEAERHEHGRLARFESSIAYRAFRTPYDSEVGVWLTRAMQRAFGKEPIRKRMSGGSIPISPFITTLGIPAVTVPTVNADNNQHSPNENLRVGNYIDGIKTFLAILTQDFE